MAVTVWRLPETLPSGSRRSLGVRTRFDYDPRYVFRGYNSGAGLREIGLSQLEELHARWRSENREQAREIREEVREDEASRRMWTSRLRWSRTTAVPCGSRGSAAVGDRAWQASHRGAPRARSRQAETSFPEPSGWVCTMLLPMARFEHRTTRTRVGGVILDGIIEVVAAQWFGSDGVELTYERTDGRVDAKVLYRADGHGLRRCLVESSRGRGRTH